VKAVNDVPVAANDSYTHERDCADPVAGAGVLGNDTDPDGRRLQRSWSTGRRTAR
jgi:hypothetical protein